MRPSTIPMAAVSGATVVASTWAVVARLAGERIPLPAVAVAVLILACGALLAAALAAHAVVHRRWWWAAGLLVLWPVLVPPYLERVRDSREPQV